METAFRHFEIGSYALWDTPFSRGEEGIPINGLIWMDDYAGMLKQIEAKLAGGYRCIKLKIGAIGFDDELRLLKHIRTAFSPSDIEIRLDANGAFHPCEALDKLNRLAEHGIHSIEQPIRSGQHADMASLAAKSPIPIALDEELIGCHSVKAKFDLLQYIRPGGIVLKPTLHGGLSGCKEWIDIAEQLDITWWITSALESNIGLNAIAQWSATFNNPLPQGLGTGALYINNIPVPLDVKNSRLHYTPRENYEAFPITFENSITPIHTSGSTGTPKIIHIRREQMLHSARLTRDALHLTPGDNALLCLPLQYISSQMMLMRAVIAGLNLFIREASGHPLQYESTSFDFAAMTPLQVYNSLAVPKEKKRLQQIKCLIIGGGSISPEMEKELAYFPHAVYSTYGMTETISHIALRRLNGPDASLAYTLLPNISIRLSRDGALVIDATCIAAESIYTNDLAEIFPNGTFRILGRKDNTINSGGIKIQSETVEEKLRLAIPLPYAITSAPDPKFGEIIILLVERGVNIDKIRTQIPSLLTKYELPRHILEVEELPITVNGKIDRYACRELASKFF
jgi:hypothetical protein